MSGTQFPQPEIGRFVLDRIIRDLLDHLNGRWGDEGPPQSLVAEYRAWVYYGRSKFPHYIGFSMLKEEREVCGHNIPFSEGARWEFIDDRWSVIYTDGSRFFTSNKVQS